MKRMRTTAAVAAVGLAAGSVALATPAQAALGTKSLYQVLKADTVEGAPSYDQNGRDFDILTGAVQTVLAAKPDSPVKVLADGDVRLTAFIPTDNAFKRTGEALGLSARSEKGWLTKYAGALGVDGVEAVLLYHVVPGVRINAATALESDGAKLTTALEQTFTVNVTKDGIRLIDKNREVTNPTVVVTDINKGNRQIAHAISWVLLPSLG